jgi:hypothetical protein
MTTGVEHEMAEVRRPIDLAGPSRFRTIAGVGPAYEIVEDLGDYVRIHVLHSDEELEYPKADAELDPLA